MYSSDFTGFNRTVIGYNNAEWIFDVSVDHCLNACAGYSPTCVLFEYRPNGQCTIQTVGWFDVDDGSKYTDLEDYVLYQRNCAT